MLKTNDQQRERLHVLDLPALYKKPSGEQLLSTLTSLTIQPASFGFLTATSQSHSPVLIDEKGIPNYLTGVIRSSLSWIEDESVKEEIWECASRRLAERAGRSAASSLTRTFELPRDASDEPPRIISIHEPSLTADNLGHKTWSSSYVLSLKLRDLARLLPVIQNDTRRVLELGSGTGLFGIAFATLFPDSDVHLTDLSEIVPNLTQNIEVNKHRAERHSSTMSASELDWNSCPEISELSSAASSSAAYNVILTADPVYSPSHPSLLIRAIAANLQRSSDARLILGLPIRDVYLPQITELWTLLKDMDLCALEEGEEECTDDWMDQQGQLVKVRVKWAVWTWK